MSAHVPTLNKIGVSQQESSRWQRIAKIPEDRFEEHLAKATKRTQSALLLEAARMQHHARARELFLRSLFR